MQAMEQCACLRGEVSDVVPVPVNFRVDERARHRDGTVDVPIAAGQHRVGLGERGPARDRLEGGALAGLVDDPAGRRHRLLAELGAAGLQRLGEDPRALGGGERGLLGRATSQDAGHRAALTLTAAWARSLDWLVSTATSSTASR